MWYSTIKEKCVFIFLYFLQFIFPLVLDLPHVWLAWNMTPEGKPPEKVGKEKDEVQWKYSLSWFFLREILIWRIFLLEHENFFLGRLSPHIHFFFLFFWKTRHSIHKWLLLCNYTIISILTTCLCFVLQNRLAYHVQTRLQTLE